MKLPARFVCGRISRMDISTSFTVHAAPEAVAEALLSEELAVARMKALGVSDYSHKREGDVAVTDCRAGAEQIPEVARRFVKNGIHVTITARKNGNRVDYSCDTHGLPAQISLTETVSRESDGVARVGVDGELKVKVPLVGAKLEKKAAEYIRPVLAEDGKLIKELLNG